VRIYPKLLAHRTVSQQIVYRSTVAQNQRKTPFLAKRLAFLRQVKVSDHKSADRHSNKVFGAKN
jgi:hypothetical protein